jgi:hypothetical protein
VLGDVAARMIWRAEAMLAESAQLDAVVLRRSAR